MKKICTFMIVACDLIIGTSALQAADLYVPPPEEVPIVTTGWYLRGDVGYNFSSSSSGEWDFWNQFPPPVRGVDDTLNYDKFSLKDGAAFGIGVGYRIDPTWRVDATVDYFAADIDGKTPCPSYVKASHGLNPVEDNCNYEDSSSADIWTVMANAYVDLAHYGAFQPYIGAGIGAANVNYDTWNTREVCEGCTYTSDKEGLNSWRFAMALMAGVSYDMTEQLKLDVGYRYTHITGGDAYGFDAADRAPLGGAPGASGTQAKDDGFDLHTVRAGLRYEF